MQLARQHTYPSNAVKGGLAQVDDIYNYQSNTMRLSRLCIFSSARSIFHSYPLKLVSVSAAKFRTMAVNGSVNFTTQCDSRASVATTSGSRAIKWAQEHMPILAAIKEQFHLEKPFKDLHIGICLHVEPKTAVWLDALVAGGARITITGSPGSTQDDVAAVLRNNRLITVLGKKSDTRDEHDAHCLTILRANPDLIADNGADLHMMLAARDEFSALRGTVRGSTEETTTGAFRLREECHNLNFPTWVINDTQAKQIVENRYGVGSSVVDALMRATNVMLHGKAAMVIGYGYCGSGVAHRLRGMGAHVTVVEEDPLRRLEAHLEGFRTSHLEECLGSAQFLITVTGRDGALMLNSLLKLRDGCIVANAGHFSSEIDLVALKVAARSEVRKDGIDEYQLNGKRVYILGGGNLVNLAAADGNPIEIMDLGLALQSLSLEQMAVRGHKMEAGVFAVSREVERMVANLAIKAWI